MIRRIDMSEEEETKAEKKVLSRRQLLVRTGAAIASGALMTSTALLASGQSAAAAPTDGKTGKTAHPKRGRSNNVPLHEQVWDFEVPPDPIPASKIKETLTTDIIIVGTGASGLPCAIAALEAGAKVIALEKLPKSATFKPGRPDLGRAIGAWYGFAGSRLYKQRGIKLDLEQLAGAQIRSALWRCDQRQVFKVVKYGEKVADWWLDILEEQGIDVKKIPIETHPEMNYQELPSQAHPRPGQYFYWHPVGHIIPCAQVEGALERHLNDNGLEITYETPVKQLIKEKNRITGVIAQNRKGYLRVNARKAIILCTGGYEGNSEMMKKYIPEYGAYKEVYGKKTNTGDGYLMAQWVGARMDPWPHSPMTWDGMCPEALDKFGCDFVGVARQPWLYVNAFGERFMNEDTLYASVGKSMFMQPRSMMWTVFDERWRDDDIQEKLAGTVCRRMTTRRIPFVLPFNTKQMHENLIREGIILKANSLEELAAKMNKAGPSLGIGADLNADTLKATVERYNQLAKSGHDSDFGKDPQKFIPCDKPPYYAIRTTVGILVTMAGPLVNDNFQVIDKEGKVIPGLYAAGNNSAGFNSYEFSMDADVGSLGRCCVSGYIAAKHAAGVPL
jgi:fumarate reductase flavoprotein subunit